MFLELPAVAAWKGWLFIYRCTAWAWLSWQDAGLSARSAQELEPGWVQTPLSISLVLSVRECGRASLLVWLEIPPVLTDRDTQPWGIQGPSLC